MSYQNTTDERDLEGGGNYVKDHGRQQEADTLCSSIDSSCQTTGLPRQVEVQVQLEQMVEDGGGNTTDGFLSHTCKDGIAKFLEDGGAYPSGTIWMVVREE